MSEAAATLIRPFGPADLEWAERLIGGGLAGRWQARLGELVDALAQPGFVAERGGGRVGLVTFRADRTDVEIVYLEASEQGAGVGTALLDEVERETRARRLWLVTTNDNLRALRFYQRRGFVMTTLRAGAVDEARRTLKPAIPTSGRDGIPIRDEIVLERSAGAWPGGGGGHR